VRQAQKGTRASCHDSGGSWGLRTCQPQRKKRTTALSTSLPVCSCSWSRPCAGEHCCLKCTQSRLQSLPQPDDQGQEVLADHVRKCWRIMSGSAGSAYYGDAQHTHAVSCTSVARCVPALNVASERLHSKDAQFPHEGANEASRIVLQCFAPWPYHCLEAPVSRDHSEFVLLLAIAVGTTPSWQHPLSSSSLDRASADLIDWLPDIIFARGVTEEFGGSSVAARCVQRPAARHRLAQHARFHLK
jgi:hypothetical protein